MAEPQLSNSEERFSWRIDELAQRSGTPVDTIRFYLREGLLPAPRRSGRLTLFGPDHLLRINQVRELQARQFTLGAIRTLIEDNRLGIIETLFAAGEGAYERSDLVAATGLPEAMVARLEEIGLLSDPADEGRAAYDNSDLQALRAVAGLLDTGMPADVVVFLALQYVEHFEALERDILEVFAGRGPVEWPEEERKAFTDRVTETIGVILPLSERLLDYVHHRTVQRLTLGAMRENPDGSAAAGPG